MPSLLKISIFTPSYAKRLNLVPQAFNLSGKKALDNFFGNDSKQWDSFLKLAEYKKSIIDTWWIKSRMKEYFAENQAEEWDFLQGYKGEYKWFLKDFGIESLCLRSTQWYIYYSLTLWVEPKFYDYVRISKLLRESKYSPILSTFEGLSGISEAPNKLEIPDDTDHTKLVKHLGLEDRLAWQARYKHEELARQILEKVNKFRLNKKITDLLRDLNVEAKK